MTNIAFFTEGGYSGQIPRHMPNMRTDVAWIHSLGAFHHDIRNTNSIPDNSYEHGFFIIPKNKDDLIKFDLVGELRRICNKVYTIQESTYWYWQGGSVESQIWYHSILQDVDIIFCHNDMDLNYYQGITDTRCELIPTLMITDYVQQYDGERSGVMIGGNWVTAYRGIDSYLIAKLLDDVVYAPTTGRMKRGEPHFTDINHLQWMPWLTWMFELSKRKYGVQLGTAAAGTFALNCAYLGIPCIGYDNVNTQRLCFPKLSVADGDIKSARKIANHLSKNKEFFNHVVAYARKAYEENYSEKVFIKKFTEYEIINNTTVSQ